MAELVRMKGRNGGTVLVNLDNILFVDTMNSQEGIPMPGYSAIAFLGMQMQICVKGTPEEIDELCQRQKRTIELAQ
jgi:hypothetical protein